MPFSLGGEIMRRHRPMGHVQSDIKLWDEFRQAYVDDVLDGKFHCLPVVGAGFRLPVPNFILTPM